jgi:branched-chain amino acid transport system permease protein
MDYILYILIIVNIYVVLAVSLNMLLGFAGLVSIAHAAFMGIGAYASTIVLLKFDVNFFLTIPLAVIIAGAISALIAIPSLRVKGDLYIIASFGFQIIIYNILLNWVSLTRGPFGFAGIPRPSLFGFSFATYLSFFFMSLCVTAVCVAFCWHLSRTPFGLILKAVREDETATSAAGKNVTYYKIVVFVTGCAIAGVGGSLYAGLIGYIDPFCFTIHDSIFILAIVIIGGSGNIKGSILGALLLISLPEILKFLHVSEAVAGPLRQMIYGALLVAFMRFRPQGLLPEERQSKI